MSDEIKEISDNIRKIIKSNREDNFNRVIYDCDSLEKLLDYITNLQKENESLQLELSGYRKAILKDDKMLGLQDRIKELEQINEEHRKLNGTLHEELDKYKNIVDELNIKTDYIEELLLIIAKSNDYKIQKEVYEKGIEYDKKLKKIKGSGS